MIPLPFPTCSNCTQSWVECRHRSCQAQGKLLIEPRSRIVQCDACYKEWELSQTTFYCSCGYIFQASDVENAINTVNLLKEQLLQQIRSMEQAEISIQQTTQESLGKWLNNTSNELGKVLGYTVGKLIKWFDGL